MEGCRKLLELDTDDEAARRAMSEIESVLLDREVDGLVGMALSYAADGEFPLATRHRREGRTPRPVEPALPAAAGLPRRGGRAPPGGRPGRDRPRAPRRRPRPGGARGGPGGARGHARPPAGPQAHRGAARGASRRGRRRRPSPTAPPPRRQPPDLHRPSRRHRPPVPPARERGAAPASASRHQRRRRRRPERPVAPPDARVAEAVALSAAALRHFLKDEHDEARGVVERALALDPSNRRALDLQKILRVLG